MDVRCEKCQTEYELDESRLKPGGVTVKCTNCGHMFKIRKRTPTNVGGVPTAASTMAGVGASKPNMPRADSMLDEAPTRTLEEGPTTVERQWVIRLENGEQKTCRELATLQQWIVSNVVSRESLISRTGKTWKRLGDITELAQYFDIADEARTGRAEKSTKPHTKKPIAGTMLGVGSGGPTAAGGTILPDDDDTGNFRAHRKPTTQPPPVPGGVRTPPMGSNVATPGGSGPNRRPITQPPGPPPKKTPTGPVPVAAPPPVNPMAMTERATGAPTPAPPRSSPTPGPAVPTGPDSRSTAMWASDPIKPTGVAPSGPYVGKLAAIPDEPAFAGRVRVSPSDESSFDTGKVRLDDDDDLMPRRSGSKAGLIILVMMLLVGAGAAAIVYIFVIKKDKTEQVATPSDAATVATVDAQSLVVTPVIDAAEAPPPTPVEQAQAELAQNVETRLRAQLESLAKDATETQTIRANLGVAVAQSLLDRAGLVADKAEADKLRKESKTIVLEAANAAQRALKTPDDPGANIAMAGVLRLQGKTPKEMQRYLDAAKAKPGAWERDLALASALVLARDGKLDDAKKAFEAIDTGPGKLETSNDVRARFHLALIALAQNRIADAKPLVDQVLAAQPEHLGAKALAAKLETKVSNTDPLPPEDPKDPKSGSGSSKPPGGGTPPDPGVGGGSYDQLLQRANKMAETSCGKAMEIYAKALEQKPNGVEALTGQGYCHIDAKQFASAFSKFRSALAISSRYEPALWGVAEAYQQQGRREQALEAYKAYLEVYPGTAKALKQVERLQAAGTPPTPTPGSGSAPAPTPTPPTPTPTPPQDPSQPQKPTEGAGSGS